MLVFGVPLFELANGLLSVTPDDVAGKAEDVDELLGNVVEVNVVEGLELDVEDVDGVLEDELAAAEDELEDAEEEEDVEDEDELEVPPVDLVPNPIWLLSKSKTV